MIVNTLQRPRTGFGQLNPASPLAKGLWWAFLGGKQKGTPSFREDSVYRKYIACFGGSGIRWSWVPHLRRYCGSFLQASSQYAVTSGGQAPAATDGLSVALWAASTGDATLRGIFSWANSTLATGPVILLQRSSSTQYRWYTSGTYRLTGNTDQGGWHHYACTWDPVSAIWRFWYDGVEQTPAIGSNTGYTSAINIYLATGYNGQLDCSIADCLVYRRTLLPHEVRALAMPANTHLAIGNVPLILKPDCAPIILTISGSTCWGHVTGVTETNVRTFADHWTGTGTISGSGDSEYISLEAGEYMISEVVNTGSQTVELTQNQYVAGDNVTLSYRTGATQAACEAASWTTYSVPFASDGYVQAKITSTL